MFGLYNTFQNPCINRKTYKVSCLGGAVFQRYLGRDKTFLWGDWARAEGTCNYSSIPAESPHKTFRPRYLVKTVPSWLRYLLNISLDYPFKYIYFCFQDMVKNNVPQLRNNLHHKSEPVQTWQWQKTWSLKYNSCIAGSNNRSLVWQKT